MRNRVLKYQIPPNGQECRILLPVHTEFLHVHSQNDIVTFWALVPQDNPEVYYVFMVFATGQSIPDDAKYIGTCHTDGGLFVWHIFLLRREEIR